MDFDRLREALKVFGQPQRATLQEIKSRHRELVRRHHPDRNSEADPQAIRRINDAYSLLLDYCSGYSFCFSREAFLEQCPEERLKEQFSDDPVWGGDRG